MRGWGEYGRYRVVGRDFRICSAILAGISSGVWFCEEEELTFTGFSLNWIGPGQRGKGLGRLGINLNWIGRIEFEKIKMRWAAGMYEENGY
ncbi:hypothetical protein H5410_052815 [Solanum commersonii]|uniref:Uncharacterized protein n=1 Tax=Solanum commersonii TaxID=4109 RepID=A0A9J5X4H4_SOLCO|nr:hypothetical protein H5410_052815 [Solanum commersonii]